MEGTKPQQGASRPRVWAIGGGKGGVGKSVITANMAIILARRGERCVLVDADLGGANLHTILGMPCPKTSLSDLFLRRVASLQDLVVPTAVPNLWLISGAQPLLEIANPAYAQKVKMIRQIFTLDFDHILIDLGAGATFNVLDFFLAAQEKIMVVVPTPTSVENAYHFLKAVFYRRLKGAIRQAGASRLVDRLMGEKVARGIRSPRDLIAQVAAASPAAGAALRGAVRTLSPGVVVNQVRKLEEKDLGRQIAMACSDFFGVPVTYLGPIRNDDRVLQAVQIKRPVLDVFPDSPFCQAVQNITMSRLEPQEGKVARAQFARGLSVP